MLAEFLSTNLGFGLSLSAFVTFLTIFWKYNLERFKSPDKPGREDRTRRLDLLRSDTATLWYRQSVYAVLEQVSSFFNDRDDFEHSKGPIPLKNANYVRKTFNGLNPWTMRSYTYCLSLSFIYPVFGFLFPWLLGADGSLADLKLLPGDSAPALRFLLFCTVSLSCIYGWAYSRAGSAQRIYVAGTIWAIATLISIYLAYTLSFPITIIIGIAGISTIAAVQARASATATVGGMFVMLVLALFFLKQFTVALPLSVAGIVFMSLQLFWHWFWKRSARKVWYIVVWQVLWVGSVILAIAELPRINIALTHEAIERTQVMLLFFVLFPLINSPLDWISLGLTRGLLGKIRDGHHRLRAMRYAFLDVALAAVFYALMISIIMSNLAFIDIFWDTTNKTSINVADLLTSFSKQPWDLKFMWIHVMAAATLLPTLVHFFCSSFATVYIVSAIIAHPLVKTHLENWPKDEVVEGDSVIVANGLLTLNVVFGVAAPVLMMHLISYWLFQGPVQSYISWLAEELARGVALFDVHNINVFRSR